MFILNAADAPDGKGGSVPFFSQNMAIETAREIFNNHSGPGEVTVSDSLHNVIFRIYRREESETPVELLA